MRDGSGALGTLREQDAIRHGPARETGRDGAVLVEDPHVQVRYRLAGGLDQVLHRLEDAGPDGAVRNGEHTVPVDMARQGVIARVAGLDEGDEAEMALGDEPRL